MLVASFAVLRLDASASAATRALVGVCIATAQLCLAHSIFDGAGRAEEQVLCVANRSYRAFMAEVPVRFFFQYGGGRWGGELGAIHTQFSRSLGEAVRGTGGSACERFLAVGKEQLLPACQACPDAGGAAGKKGSNKVLETRRRNRTVEMTPTQRKYYKAAGGGVVYTHTRHVFALDSRLDGGEVVLFLLNIGLFYRYCTTHDERQKKHRRAKARRRGGVN